MIQKQNLKLNPKKNKGYLTQFLNERDKLSFFLVISYRKTNTFLTFYYKNYRVNKCFILYKLSCGFIERKTTKLSKFQRNRFRYTFGLMRPRIIRMFRYISYFFFYNTNLMNNNLFILWKIFKVDHTLLLIMKKCSFLKVINEIINKFSVRKYKAFIKQGDKLYKLKKKRFKLFKKIFTSIIFKRSHNGCRLSKRRVIKKKRAKKILNFQKKDQIAMFSTLVKFD